MNRFFISGKINRILPPTGSTISCVGRDDGAGSGMCGRISTLLFARVRGLTYHHTPLMDVTHVPEGVEPLEWTRSWEVFFNLGKNEIQAAPQSRIWLRNSHRCFLLPGRHYQANNCHRYVARFPELYQEFRGEFREKYFASPKPVLDLSSDDHNIAVHIRRGDVSASDNPDRFTPLERVVPFLQQMIREKSNARIRVFSEGDPKDFEVLAGLDQTSLHLNLDPLATFHHLVMADGLFMAKSSFSFLAGLLSKGTCYYEPFYYFYPKMKDWKDCPWK